MKKFFEKFKFLFILTFMIVFSFYRVDSIVARANVQPDTVYAESELITGPQSGQNTESAAISVPDLEQSGMPATETAPDQNGMPATETAPDQNEISATVSEPNHTEENVAESEPEPIPEPNPAPETVSAPVPDYISTGSALIEWLESHKNTGGFARLTDNVTLTEYYAFCPDGIGMPPVYVDTDKYTITIACEIELLSDNHLIFLGQPDSSPIFRVADKGMLSMSGITVEGGQCALWQEEGTGLVLEDCHISGSIHYADTPFVMYENSICVIVEKGQTVNDVLPAQLECVVNSKGDVSNKALPVSWMLDGTEKRQEERLRFKIQGSFLHAASSKELFCTVVYNDYPLTFTDMRASLCYNAYLFQGWYTKPEECLPITVISEYSFDGENWLMYEENIVSNVNASFTLCLTLEQWDTAAHPDIYIRQQWNDNGIIHFSNVLCYAADNLECEQDIGGSRGGGTSITNPPDEPKKNTEAPSSKKESGSTNNNTASDGSGKDKSDTNQTESSDNGNGSDMTGDGQSSNADSQNTETQAAGAKTQTANANNASKAETQTANASNASKAETQTANAGQPSNAGSQTANTGQPSNAGSQTASASQPSYSETKTDNNVSFADDSDNKESINNNNTTNNGNFSQITEQTLRSDISQGNNIVIAICFIIASVIAGVVIFCAHAHILRNKKQTF